MLMDGRLKKALQGLGQLWQKTYKIQLSDVQVFPQKAIKVWNTSFSEFWPKGYRYFGSTQGIRAGEVAVLNLASPRGLTAPGSAPLISTGVDLIYSDWEIMILLQRPSFLNKRL